jgi:hypothetical protein
MSDQPLEADRALERAAFGVAPAPPSETEDAQKSLVYESGLEVEVRSQWTYARRRFFRHRLAVASLVILVVILVSGPGRLIAPYRFDGYDLNNIGASPARILRDRPARS